MARWCAHYRALMRRTPHQSCGDHLRHLLLNLLVFCVQAPNPRGLPVVLRVRSERMRKRKADHTHTLVLEVVARGLALTDEERIGLFNPCAEVRASRTAPCCCAFAYAPCDCRMVALAGWGCTFPVAWQKARNLALLRTMLAPHCASGVAALGGSLALGDELDSTAFTASIPVTTDPDAPSSRSASSKSKSSRTDSGASSSSDLECDDPLSAGADTSSCVGPPLANVVAEETGLHPFLPPGMPPAETLESLYQRGRLADAVDLVRALVALPPCMLRCPAGVLTRLDVAHRC
jgi:hypothetical protein